MLRDADTRRLFNIKTDTEIRNTLVSLLGQVGPPVQVVFNTSVCLDCSVKGDRRLLPRHCHMEPEDVHPGQVSQYMCTLNRVHQTGYVPGGASPPRGRPASSPH